MTWTWKSNNLEDYTDSIGTFTTMEYTRQGYVHRISGPAVVYHDPHDADWALDGLYCSRSAYFVEILRRRTHLE